MTAKLILHCTSCIIAVIGAFHCESDRARWFCVAAATLNMLALIAYALFK